MCLGIAELTDLVVDEILENLLNSDAWTDENWECSELDATEIVKKDTLRRILAQVEEDSK